MNQILVSEDKTNKKSKKTSSSVDTKKIIIIFAILILLFGLCIGGVKVFDLIKNYKNKRPMAKLNKPEIKVEKIDDQCRIRIEYDEGISRVTYTWNDGNPNIKNTNGSNPFETLIDVPEGDENILYVKAIGTDDSENEITKVFGENGIENDSGAPTIKWEQINGTNSMIISASSRSGIQSLTYQWENDEEVIIEGNSEEEVKATIDIKRGTNKIKITAVDINKNEEVKEENIVGILYPEIEVYVQDGTLYMIVRHDMGFKKVVFKVNDQELIYDENNPEYKKDTRELKTDVPLGPGKTMVEITAYSLEHEKSVKEYKGQIEI